MATELTNAPQYPQRKGPSQFRFIILLMATYFIAISVYLVTNILEMDVHAARGAETLVSTDSQHYLAFAKRFLAGNFSMDFYRDAPHRQPLYPLLLAVASKIGNGNLFFLGEVNVVAMTLVIGSVYLAVLHFFRSPSVAAISAICAAGNRFLWRIAGERLLTEPLYVLLLIWVIIAFLQYLRESKLLWLLLGSAIAGLAYLTRPNGIFAAAAFLGALFLAEMLLPPRSGEPNSVPLIKLCRLLPKYLSSAVVLIFVTIPSWVPRSIYFGDPFFNGYLSNFLWVDTYQTAHNFSARYTWHDYVANHTILDVIRRVSIGLANVCVVVPVADEKIPILFLLSIAGIWTVLRKGPREYRFLLLFFFMQLLPFIWTYQSNPNGRVSYGSTFPFEPFFAACFLTLFATKLDAALRWRLRS